eukprot:8906186-Karenia_brevis.AAC.1
MREAKDPGLTVDKSAVEDIRRGTQLNDLAAASSSGAPGLMAPGAGQASSSSDAAQFGLRTRPAPT